MEQTFIITPLNCIVNNPSSIKVMDLVKSTFSSLILEARQSIDFRGVTIPCEHSDRVVLQVVFYDEHLSV